MTQYDLELIVFAFAHQVTRLWREHAHYVSDVNPFIVGLDRFDEPRDGHSHSPVGTTQHWRKDVAPAALGRRSGMSSYVFLFDTRMSPLVS